jgi:hypothetical protein
MSVDYYYSGKQGWWGKVWMDAKIPGQAVMLQVATGQQPLGSSNRTSRLPAATTRHVLLKRLPPQTACFSGVVGRGEVVDERMLQTGPCRGGQGGDKCVGRCARTAAHPGLVYLHSGCGEQHLDTTRRVEFSNRTWTKGTRRGSNVDG